jgi:Bacteriocin-protection, YdeI or OmpD-Associated
MRSQQFDTRVGSDSGGRAVISIPFDPDERWGPKAFHLVGGHIQPAGGSACSRYLRGKITRDGDDWVFTLNPMWMRETGVAVGDEVAAELWPEGPQRSDLADDIAAALAANPAAAAFFDTLAQFYRNAYLRWIDATKRSPELRAARIAEMVDLLAADRKERQRQ